MGFCKSRPAEGDNDLQGGCGRTTRTENQEEETKKRYRKRGYMEMESIPTEGSCLSGTGPCGDLTADDPETEVPSKHLHVRQYSSVEKGPSQTNRVSRSAERGHVL